VEEEKLFEPIEELEFEKVFVKMIDELIAIRGIEIFSDIGKILVKLAKKYPKESIFFLRAIAEYTDDFEMRNNAIDILCEMTLKSIIPAEKPEIAEMTPSGDETGG
jgi:hypothetical protein